MSRQRDREEFVSIMAREAPNVPLHVVQALMRAETTLHRLAELQCSDEAYDRDRVQCPADDAPHAKDCIRRQSPSAECSCFKANGPCLCRDNGNFDETTGQHGSVPRGNVREAQLQHKLTRMVEPYGIGLHFNGDPRGPAILVGVPSGFTNDWGKRGICVP